MYKNIPNEELYNKIYEWLKIYHSTTSASKKTRMKSNIVANMVPVVKKLAKTIARRAYDPIEDLTQAGFIGLLKAIDSYSMDKGTPFKVYAGYYIIGEIRHYIRDKMKMIHVPRYIQELCCRINNFTDTLTYQELNDLTSEQVASILNVPQKTIDIAMDTERRKNVMSYENIFLNDPKNNFLDKFIAEPEINEEKPDYYDIKIIYNDIIKLLPPDEQLIIDLYYNQDMNQREIGEVLEISKMSVYRKMKNAFNFIIDYIENNSEKKQTIMEYFEIGDENNDDIFNK